jgi:hypothetical protein
MMTKSKVALTSAFILGAASAALAMDSGPPSIDLQKTCRDSSNALIVVTGNDAQDSFNTCMSDEQAARDQLTKDWASYPTLAKSKCLKPKEFPPGYVEWQSCLEMTRDVIKMGQDQATAAPADSHISGQSSGRRTDSKSRGECPVVQIAEDGSIKSVIAC